MRQGRKILIVIPCKNEESTVKTTLLSLLHQEDCELEIVLVDDGSTDSTAELVQDLAAQHEQLTYESTAFNKQRESGAGIAKVVRYGLSKFDLKRYDYIAKFDADLEFPQGYLSTCLQEFEKDVRLGLVGGSCSIQSQDGTWSAENVTNHDHVRGALKMYRTKAYLEMGGVVSATGWDTIDEHKLRFNNWTFKSIPDLQVKQFRETNAATDPKKMGRKIGLSLYNMRYNLLVVLVSIGKRAFFGNSRLPFMSMLRGYLRGHKNGTPRFLTIEESKVANQYRMSEYYRKLGLK